MPSYSELGKKVGITRQTASTRVKELIDNDIISIDEDKIVVVRNDLDFDVEKIKEYLETSIEFNSIELRNFLFDTNLTRMEIGKELKMARQTIYSKPHSVVYGIVSEGKIKYVGTTKQYDQRIKQHIAKRPFLTQNNFIILAEITNEKFNLESELINLLKPEWNG